MRSYFLIVLFSSLFITFIIILIRSFDKYIKAKEIFLSFLNKENDTKTLFKIGETNQYGVEEKHRVMFYSVSDWLLTKYRETKKNEYLVYESCCEKILKSQIICCLGVFISGSIVLVLVVNLFS